jgi:hypothetical protein
VIVLEAVGKPAERRQTREIQKRAVLIVDKTCDLTPVVRSDPVLFLRLAVPGEAEMRVGQPRCRIAQAEL